MVRVSESNLNSSMQNYYMASFHRPPNFRNESLTSIHYDIGNTMMKYRHMQRAIGGDFILPGVNWLEEEILDGPSKSDE